MKICLFLSVLALLSASSLCIELQADLAKLAAAYKRWESNLMTDRRAAMAEAAEKIYNKRNLNNPIDEIIGEETARKIRTPLSESATWEDTDRVKISESSDGVHIESPFFSGEIRGVTREEAGALIMDQATAQIRSLEDTVRLVWLKATLSQVVCVIELGIPQAIVIYAHFLGGIAANENPVPEFDGEDDDVLESDGVTKVRYRFLVQDNWASTLESTTQIKTYYPYTRGGVVSIVKKAKSEGKRVRASGLKHSWNHWLWGVDNRYEDIDALACDGGEVDYFIAMVPWELSDQLYFKRDLNLTEWIFQASELTFIQGPIDTWTGDDGTEHASVKVGAAALSKTLGAWGVQHNWYLPSEPFTPLFTIAGVISTASHGSGWNFPTVSDFVMEVEYVDEKGDIQVADRSWMLSAVAASYGLFGIILSVTVRMDRMVLASYNPVMIQTPMDEYFPRPGNDIPQSLINLFEDHHFGAWFVVPDYSASGRALAVTQHVWKADGQQNLSIPFVGPEEEGFAISVTYLMASVNSLFKDILDIYNALDYLYWVHGSLFTRLQVIVTAISVTGVPALVTTATEAMQFQRGLHALPLRNLEFNVPIADDGNGKPDWKTFQDIWWLVQDTIDEYEEHGLFPTDFLVNYRLVGTSDMVLDSNFENEFGTVSFDISATPVIPNKLWDFFRADIAGRLQEYSANREDNMRPARPHLGKEAPVNVTGTPTSLEYYQDVFGNQINKFLRRYTRLVNRQGSTVEDTRQRFSTKFFDQLFDACQEQ